MTRRDSADPLACELSPLDPSLEENPVPKILDLTTYSIGPGAASDASATFTSAEELLIAHQAGDEDILQLVEKTDELQAILCEPGRQEDLNRSSEEENALVEAIRDRTWGFYVFVNSYDSASQSALPSALEKLTQCVHFSLQRAAAGLTHPAVADQAWRRFRLEILQHQDVLSNASSDRLRAVFIALMRAKRPDFGEHGRTLPMGPKYNFFLVLDCEAVQTIASFEVPNTYTDQQKGSYESMNVRILKAVSAEWRRPEKSRSSYRGWHAVSPMALHDLFLRLGDGDSHALEDIFDAEQMERRTGLAVS